MVAVAVVVVVGVGGVDDVVADVVVETDITLRWVVGRDERRGRRRWWRHRKLFYHHHQPCMGDVS